VSRQLADPQGRTSELGDVELILPMYNEARGDDEMTLSSHNSDLSPVGSSEEGGHEHCPDLDDDDGSDSEGTAQCL
jgi:hypothetical protein